MPQLDFSNPLTIAQVVWMAIIFGLLYYILARYMLPQVAEVVDGRAHRIAADLDSARAAKAQSDAAIAEITAAGQRANSEAQPPSAAPSPKPRRRRWSSPVPPMSACPVSWLKLSDALPRLAGLLWVRCAKWRAILQAPSSRA